MSDFFLCGRKSLTNKKLYIIEILNVENINIVIETSIKSNPRLYTRKNKSPNDVWKSIRIYATIYAQ